MRHRAVQVFSKQVGDSVARPAKFSSIRLTGATMLFLLLTATFATANSDTILATQIVSPEELAPPAALEEIESDPGDFRAGATPHGMLLPRKQRPNLAALLAIRFSGSSSSTERTPDEALADAIALGPRPELESKNPYRKRKIDLFRIVRPVSIGNKDLLVRFRLRSNRRRLMALDVRF